VNLPLNCLAKVKHLTINGLRFFTALRFVQNDGLAFILLHTTQVCALERPYLARKRVKLWKFPRRFVRIIFWKVLGMLPGRLCGKLWITPVAGTARGI
jgi:hypothetical protein